MKLLLDNNLSFRLISEIEKSFPGSTHVRDVDLESADDAKIWAYAKQHDFAIVSKDDDFRQLSLLYEFPPKVVWLRLGNCSTKQLQEFLGASTSELIQFLGSDDGAYLVLGAGRGAA